MPIPAANQGLLMPLTVACTFSPASQKECAALFLDFPSPVPYVPYPVSVCSMIGYPLPESQPSNISTRFLESSLPPPVLERLSGALQKALELQLTTV